ncbi:failed axon connections [Cladorrhinum sp. PSN259]|nr:failed axon connections [Cladorrhinum sp. PSN259]
MSPATLTNHNIIVHRGFPTTPSHAWSPFVNKLELRLRLDSVPYSLAVGTPRAAPRGKIPYISTDLYPGQLLGDTTLISHRLIACDILTDLNANLTPQQKAQDLALRALLEDKLYFFQARERWVDNYYAMRDGVMSQIPYPLRVLVGNFFAYKSVVSMLWGQGTGRYTDEEAKRLKGEVWEGVDALVEEARRKSYVSSSASEEAKGKKMKKVPFWVLGGEQPTEADASLYGFVVSCLVCDAAPESQEIVRKYPALVDYARRIHDAYFEDYELWEETV